MAGSHKYASLCTSRAEGVGHFIYVRTHCYLNSSSFNVCSIGIPETENHFLHCLVITTYLSNLHFVFWTSNSFDFWSNFKFEIYWRKYATLSIFVKSVSTQLECKYTCKIVSRNSICPKYPLISKINGKKAPFYGNNV